jgi:hypothetical protein
MDCLEEEFPETGLPAYGVLANSLEMRARRRALWERALREVCMRL